MEAAKRIKEAQDLAYQEKYDAALTLFEESTKIRKDKDAFFGMATCCHLKEDYIKAEYYAGIASSMGSEEAKIYLKEYARNGAAKTDNQESEIRYYVKIRTLDENAVNDLKMLVQQNAESYVRKFAAIDLLDYKKMSASMSITERMKLYSSCSLSFWTAFLVLFLGAPTYFFYRKMYGMGMLIAIATIFIGIFVPKYAIWIAGAFFVKFFGARLYYRRLKKVIAAADAMQLSAAERSRWFNKRGGVNVYAPLVYFLVSIALVTFFNLKLRNLPVPRVQPGLHVPGHHMEWRNVGVEAYFGLGGFPGHAQGRHRAHPAPLGVEQGQLLPFLHAVGAAESEQHLPVVLVFG